MADTIPQRIKPSTVKDIPELILLLNSAYRGEGSRKGWTTEADLLLGNQRMDEETLAEHFARPDAVLLKYTADTGDIAGCVYLEKKGARLYLGMLSVDPAQQAAGIGKQLLAAAIEQARATHCNRIYMTVISERKELIDWYKRHGYAPTGETTPFAPEEKFGIPTRPLEFMVLEKKLE